MLFMYHAVGTDLNGFPEAGTKPLSEFSVVELWSALQCRIDPEKYRDFRFKDDFVLDTLEHGHEAYRERSDNLRVRAETLLEESRVQMKPDRERMHSQCLTLVREYNDYHACFLERIRELGCFSGLVSSTFVRPTDEQMEQAAILRRAMRTLDAKYPSEEQGDDV